MFYVFSKILDLAVTPIAWAVTLIIFGAFARQGARRGRAAILLGVVVLLGFSLEPVANGLIRTLESPRLRTFRPGVRYDAVILLGGVSEDRVAATWGERAFNNQNERLLQTYDLLRSGAARNAILSGGSAYGAHVTKVDARVLADQLVAWGISPDRLVVEDQARNTHENATESAALARSHGWTALLIVTSAYHMPRADGCFRAEGLAVDTLPVDFRSFASTYPVDALPRAEYLDESSLAIREWVGRWVYRVRGYSR